MTAEQIEMRDELQPRWWPMIGVHLGLITVIFGAIYTAQFEGAVSRMEFGGYIVIGLALLLAGVIPAWDVRSVSARGLLAMGGAVALYLAYDPQLAGLPGGGALVETPVANLQPSIAHFGVAIAGLFLALQAAIDRRILPREVPFRGALLAAALLLIAITAAMSLALSNIYDLSMTASPSVLVFRIVAYGLLMLVCVTIPGVRGAGRGPHIYFGLALLAAVARNLLVA